MIIEIFLFLITLYFLSIVFNKPNQNLPPGPWGIPLIGNKPIGTIKECVKVQKKYGNLFMTRTGVTRFLFICDYKIAKEALSKLEMANRPNWKFLSLFPGERKLNKANGIIFSNDEHWHHNRRFLLRHLRDLGMGKSKIEGIMLREVENLIEDFKLLTKEPSVLPFSINVAILNIIWQLVSSHRFDFSDNKVKSFMGQIHLIQRYLITLAIPDFFPILRYIIPSPILNYVIGQNKFYVACSEFESIVHPIIEEHEKKLDLNNPCDLMDDYLIEMNEKKSQEYSHFSYTDLTRITFDLFLAGNDTTSNMTRWTLLYMAKFQNIQKKIQDEIDKVVITDTIPRLEHRESLAYLDATINEVQRHCSMTAFGVFRSTAADTTLNGYLIPKGTIVRSIAALSHRDPQYWKNPEDFDPTRFLDFQGKYVVSSDGFQAFGIGKRQCLGEQFARMELYLIIAALLQNFTFEPPDGVEINITPDDILNFHFPRKNQKFVIKLRR